jgi:hypothetical protein
VALHEVILAGVDFYRALDRGKFKVPLHEVRVVRVHKGVFRMLFMVVIAPPPPPPPSTSFWLAYKLAALH